MTSFGGIVCIILCVYTCLSIPICEDSEENGCIVFVKPYDVPYFSENPSVEISEIKVYTVNPTLHLSQDVTIVVPKLMDYVHEEPLNEFKTLKSYLPDKLVTQKDVEKLSSHIKYTGNRIKELEYIIRIMYDKVDKAEQQAKVNNLIFTNVKETKNESHKTTLKIVLDIINIVMKVRMTPDDISMALRVNSNRPGEDRPIVVGFINFDTKMRVLLARHRLISSNIQLSADFSERVNQRRKELLPFLLKKKSQGHDAFIVYDKLVVDGVKVSLQDLKAEKKDEDENEEVQREDDMTMEDWPGESPSWKLFLPNEKST